MHPLMANYNAAKRELYKHVHFEEEHGIYAVEDLTQMFWRIDIDQSRVYYAKTLDEIISKGDYFIDTIERRYQQPRMPVYRGAELTLIVIDTHFEEHFCSIFDNSKEISL